MNPERFPEITAEKKKESLVQPNAEITDFHQKTLFFELSFYF